MRISDWSSDVCSSDLVCRRGHLHVLPTAFHQRDREAGALGNGGIVSQLLAGSAAVRFQDLGVAEALRRLRAPQAGPVAGAGDAAAVRLLQGVDDRKSVV